MLTGKGSEGHLTIVCPLLTGGQHGITRLWVPLYPAEVSSMEVGIFRYAFGRLASLL